MGVLFFPILSSILSLFVLFVLFVVPFFSEPFATPPPKSGICHEKWIEAFDRMAVSYIPKRIPEVVLQRAKILLWTILRQKV